MREAHSWVTLQSNCVLCEHTLRALEWVLCVAICPEMNRQMSVTKSRICQSSASNWNPCTHPAYPRIYVTCYRFGLPDLVDVQSIYISLTALSIAKMDASVIDDVNKHYHIGNFDIREKYYRYFLQKVQKKFYYKTQTNYSYFWIFLPQIDASLDRKLNSCVTFQLGRTSDPDMTKAMWTFLLINEHFVFNNKNTSQMDLYVVELIIKKCFLEMRKKKFRWM